MGWFLLLGIGGLLLLGLVIVLDGVLDGLFDGFAGADGWLSLPAVTAFVSMLGFVGAIAQGATGMGPAPAAAVGAAAGAGTAWGVLRLSRALMGRQPDAAPRGVDLVGVAGAVITPIPDEGYGEVLLDVAGLRTKYAARSRLAVPAGAEVWVVDVLSPTSVEVRSVER
ncbi:hypothetical protein [Streptomyces sp. NPDC127098]|uniref:hypothetical protein n=1 Tax=Streptomyces sp. NPDC127098 TaxID=3347137 RepID=UPI003660CA28